MGSSSRPKIPGSESSILDQTTTMRLQTARAALSAGVGEVIARALTVVLAIVTARSLDPREVGLLSLAVIVMGVISMIGCYPGTAAVAAHDRADHNAYAFVAMIINGVAVAVLLGLVAGGMSLLGDEVMGGPGGRAQFRQLVWVLAWGPIIECLSGYPQVILQRRLDLRFGALVQVVQAVVFVGLATILLLARRGYMGVAVASLIGTAAAFVMVWSRIWRRSWFSFERWPVRAVWRETVVGSFRVFLGGFGGYLGNRLDNLLVAGAMGPTAMSYYSMAWNASRTPAGIISKAITFVMIPTFARMQNEAERVERGLKECLQVSYLALAPTCAIMLVCAPDLVTIVLGPKWTPMIPALRLMSITVLVSPLLDTANAVLVGSGRAQLSVVAGIARIVVLLIIMQPLARRWGVGGAVWGDLISATASAIALFAVAQGAVRSIRWPLASALVSPVVAALFAGALAWGLGSHLDAGYLRLACQAGILAGSYPLIFAAVGGKASLVSLGALMRSALMGRIAVTES